MILDLVISGLFEKVYNMQSRGDFYKGYANDKPKTSQKHKAYNNIRCLWKFIVAWVM